MLELLSSIEVSPVACQEIFTMGHYYSDMTEFNRLTYDSKNTSKQVGILIFSRMFPIMATEQDIEKMNKLKGLIERWMEIALIAPNPISIPQCMRCCCCRHTKRTSCGFFYK